MQKLAMALALVLCGQAMAADWVEVHSDHEATGYVDTESVQEIIYNGQKMIGAWYKIELANPHIIDNKTQVSNYRIYTYFKCQDRQKSNSLRIVGYDKRGNAVLDNTERVTGFEPIIPDTNSKLLWHGVCLRALSNEALALHADGRLSDYTFNQLSKKYPHQFNDFIEYLSELQF